MEYSEKDWRRIDHEVKANRSLRSFEIGDDFSSINLPPTSFIERLCTNETLKNITCFIFRLEKYRYSGESRINHSMCICFSFSFKMITIMHRYTRQLSEVPVNST